MTRKKTRAVTRKRDDRSVQGQGEGQAEGQSRYRDNGRYEDRDMKDKGEGINKYYW